MDFKTYFLSEGIIEKLPLLVQQYGIKLAKFMKLDIKQPTTDQKLKQYIDDVAGYVDPTYPKADYITWLLKLVIAKTITLPEDAEKITGRLVQFDRLKRTSRFTGTKDILQYKTFAALAKTIDDNNGVVSKGQEIRTKSEQGVELVKEMGGYKLWRVSTPEAAAKLFRGTDWCVKDPKYFKQYAEKDPNFYYVEKDGDPTYLAHFGSEQLKDVNDDTLEDVQPDYRKDLVKLFSDLPEYIALKRHHLHMLQMPGSNTPPEVTYVDEYINSTIDGIEHYITPITAKKILKSRKAAENVIRNILNDGSAGDSARDAARDGLIDDGSGTEFAPLLNIDDMSDVVMYQMSYNDEPDMFEDAVMEYIASITPEEVQKYTDTLIKKVKATDISSFGKDGNAIY